MNSSTLIKILEMILVITKQVNYSPKMGIRRKFTKIVKQKTLARQAYRCKLCGKFLSIINFDHIDGNRSNNHISNCQALCPNCHAIKTRSIKKRNFFY